MRCLRCIRDLVGGQESLTELKRFDLSQGNQPEVKRLFYIVLLFPVFVSGDIDMKGEKEQSSQSFLCESEKEKS